MADFTSRSVGCGAFRVIDDHPGTDEIMRMCVAPSARANTIAGCLECEPWGEFIGKDFSVCMAKTVVPG